MLSEFKSKVHEDINKQTYKNYSCITKLKTAYYSFSLPVRLALYLSQISSEDIHFKAERVLLKIGHFFQVQDDYLDCFGDPEVIRKIGTDIEEGKCCWPFVTSLSLCNKEQKKTLFENYGKKDAECVTKIKSLYQSLDLRKRYQEYEESTYAEIKVLIGEFKDINLSLMQVFNIILAKIYKREN